MFPTLMTLVRTPKFVGHVRSDRTKSGPIFFFPIFFYILGKAMEEIQPIPFIKNFLLRYVDEAALQRRQSQAAEDDNPPSPTMVGGMYILIFNQFIDHCFQVNDCSSKILLIKGGTQSCDRQTYVLTKIMNRDNKNWAHF